MLRLLLSILAPGEKLPSGTTQFSITYEGLSWGWAFFAFVVLVAGVTWSYFRYAPNLARGPRTALILLRSILLGLLLLLLVRPILLLTIEEASRRPLLVLLDTTQSMGLIDKRTTLDDIARVAIAKGTIDPAGGLKQTVSTPLHDMPRKDLLVAMAENTKLSLWPRLAERSTLSFFGFGRKLSDLGPMPGSEGGLVTTDTSANFFRNLQNDADLTAIGDGLRDLLDGQRGQPPAGILLITDGANNSGSAPLDAAAIAKKDGVPLFIYGLGITSPKDILVAQLEGPQTSNVKERLQMTAHIRVHGLAGRKAIIQLKADGKVVDEQPIDFNEDGDQEATLGYVPAATGLVHLEAFIPPLPEEAVTDNNTASTVVRIVDDKIKVLLVEEEPSWDYQYLSQMLENDRRIAFHAVVIHGDANLVSDANSPFLESVPDNKEKLFDNDLIILGDVDPADLGVDRMTLITEWVDKMGGGLIFQAGTKFDPRAYHGTPLEPLLPVEPSTKDSDPYDEPIALQLTTAGQSSPLLSLAQNPQENVAIWNGFPPVRWTAAVDKARPGAQVLLTDPTPTHASHDGPEPVIAVQNYGAGETLYVGEMETYRWRSHIGGKYYTQVWIQMIQALASQHQSGSKRIQLKTDRASYLAGDHVKISGRIYQAGFTPLTDAEVPGTLTITPDATSGQPAAAPRTQPLRLQQLADRPGEYKADTVASVTGSYSYAIARDPSVTVRFDVMEPHVELSDIAMNETLLRAMAASSGGHFLREEDLNKLPDMIVAKAATGVTFKKIPLTSAAILLVLMLLVACAEWLWRRRLELK